MQANGRRDLIRRLKVKTRTTRLPHVAWIHFTLVGRTWELQCHCYYKNTQHQHRTNAIFHSSCDHMQQWQYAAVTICSSDNMQLWQYAAVTICSSDNMQLWQYAAVTICSSDNMQLWQYAAVTYIVNTGKNSSVKYLSLASHRGDPASNPWQSMWNSGYKSQHRGKIFYTILQWPTVSLRQRFALTFNPSTFNDM
jgi:hypothetical protein